MRGDGVRASRENVVAWRGHGGVAEWDSGHGGGLGRGIGLGDGGGVCGGQRPRVRVQGCGRVSVRVSAPVFLSLWFVWWSLSAGGRS